MGGDLGASGPVVVTVSVLWVRRDLRLTDHPALLAADDGAVLPLVVRSGDPTEVVPHAAAAVGAARVHVTRDATPAGRERDEQVTARLAAKGVELFRVFNPVSQGQRFDPDGEYVRRWVPELAHLAGPAAHAPWDHDEGHAHGYPEPVVDHAEERREALARYDAR